MKKRNVFWGLLFIITAVLIIMNQFGLFSGIGIFDIVMTVFMVGIIIVSIRQMNFWGVLFPLAIIGIIFDEELNITNFTPWPILLTAFLISLGLSLIFDKNKFRIVIKNDLGKTVVNEFDSNVINCSTTFGECIKYVNTDNFEKAYVKCVFGDVKLYFDNAEIPSGKADIYLDVSFGDVDLYLPSTWRVNNETHGMFGDITIRSNSSSDGPEVTIHGNVSFGDVDII